MTNSAKSLLTILLSVMLAMGAVSCGSQRHTATKSTSVTYKKTSDKHKAPPRRTTAPLARVDIKAASGNPVVESLLKEADSWIGTPYSWGGNDRNGVDCSGFVLQVYSRSLKIDLPRNSEKQMMFCRKIEREELTPGDLVFFTVRGGNRVGHVGIYIGGGNMVHSSSSKGVVVTPLDNPYFVKNYYSSGRVDRFYAMLEKHKKPAKARVPAASPVKPKTTREVSLETLTASTRKKAESKPSGRNLSTPMPSQVFASGTEKKHEVPSVSSDETEEVPDYDLFD